MTFKPTGSCLLKLIQEVSEPGGPLVYLKEPVHMYHENGQQVNRDNIDNCFKHWNNGTWKECSKEIKHQNGKVKKPQHIVTPTKIFIDLIHRRSMSKGISHLSKFIDVNRWSQTSLASVVISYVRCLRPLGLELKSIVRQGTYIRKKTPGHQVMNKNFISSRMKENEEFIFEFYLRYTCLKLLDVFQVTPMKLLFHHKRNLRFPSTTYWA